MMKVDQEETRLARSRHEQGIGELDKLFGFDRKRDGRGFLLAAHIRARIQWHRASKRRAW